MQGLGEAEVSLDEAPPTDKIIITASPKTVDLLFKAVTKVVSDNKHTESINYLQQQNSAAKHLVDEIDQAFDIMTANLVKQVEKVFASEDEESIKSKTDK